MGQQVAARTFSREDRQRYRAKVRANLDVFARMLGEARFHPERRSFGLEIELNLTDDTGDPALVNAAALEAIADPAFQTELGQFNVEINVPPRLLEGEVFTDLERDARASLNDAEERARTVGAHMMIIGILPTVTLEHLRAEVFSANPRYALLNEQIFAARGEDLEISIEGVERLSTHADTIAPEAACTSVQLHQQVDPEAFAPYWNAAQAIAGVQVAVAANSPFFCGKELWRETRIAVFEQSTDTRPEELKVQGVRPRVWFGERWITSIFDLFEENVRYFPSLLPVCEDEDPLETLERGDVPRLGELRLHNGTIYRWNRPIYDVVRDQPHLRVENRVLPAGPSVVDILANAAFYYGLLRMLGRGGPAAVVADVVLGRGGELPRRRPRGNRRARVLAGTGRSAGRRAGGPAPVAAGARRPGALGSGHPGRRPSARHHRAALRVPAQRRVVAEPGVPSPAREQGPGPAGGAAGDDPSLP